MPKNKFLKLFIQSDEEETTEQAQPQTHEAIATTNAKLGIGVDLELAKEMMEEISNGAYTGFFDMVKSMGEYMKDESSCFKAAFTAISKISPTTAEKLMLKVDDCVNGLKAKKAEFLEEVEKKNQEAKSLASDILGKDKQIADLQQQITTLNAEKQSIAGKVKSIQQKVEKAIADYNSTYDAVQSTLQENKKKIGNYLKGA
jgi:chromosome segregation ATPase